MHGFFNLHTRRWCRRHTPRHHKNLNSIGYSIVLAKVQSLIKPVRLSIVDQRCLLVPLSMEKFKCSRNDHHTSTRIKSKSRLMNRQRYIYDIKRFGLYKFHKRKHHWQAEATTTSSAVYDGSYCVSFYNTICHTFSQIN